VIGMADVKAEIKRKKLSAHEKSLAHPYASLPFVETPKKGMRIFWAPRSTGDYHHDIILGEAYADAAIPMVRTDPLLLGFIVLDILRYGEESRDRGTIVGFMSRLSLRLIVGPATILSAARKIRDQTTTMH
jgi:hypothetical protein